MFLLLVGVPLLIAALGTSKKDDMYSAMYRLEDPDRYTPGERQFDPGFLVMTPGAEGVFQRAEDAVSQVTGRDVSGMLMSQIYTHHSEGDWGKLEEIDPAWAAEQDRQMDTEGVGWGVTGIHSIGGTDVWVKTVSDPAGNVTTFYLPRED